MPSSSKTTSLSMGDRSSATRFCVGDAVTVVEEVAKAGKSLRGLSGVVVETWEKCDVDPTCCCAEWVDESLSIRVRFAASKDSGNGLFTNDSFFHYFSESELLKEKENSAGDAEVVAFDGLSCKAFKLEKLSMGQQAKRIATFEETRH
ncbi:hypothetical protein ACHAW5_008577 [Stephanodiscus triporus]|uniref:Uncharacterized protein n=1 Tax=Stephanodiscus triporus TaxID=2934178 RepID=A0ABD3MQZ3_9STRA